MFKKLQLTLLAIMATGAILFAPVHVFAEDACDVPGAPQNSAFCEGQDQGQNDTANDNIVLDILRTTVSILGATVAVISVITIIVSGIMFTVSGGDAAKAAKARNALIYAIVALVVSIFARAIILFVLREL